MPADASPPTADVLRAWERYGYCCACFGCDGHFHICDRTEEERAESRRKHDEAVSAALTWGPGRHMLSDGSWITVQRGPGDPEYPKGDGFDGPDYRGADCR